MKSIKMIVGLGNSVDQYQDTRHNAGFWFIDALSERYKVTLQYKKKFLGYVASIVIDNKKIYLLKPNLFMNMNGCSVIQLSYFYKIRLSEILVVRDELDLLPGVLKIKFGTSHSGHNGVKSIINGFKKNSSFFQLCIGIGRPRCRKNIAHFVLEAPSVVEKKMITKSILRFISIIQHNMHTMKLLQNKKFIEINKNIY